MTDDITLIKKPDSPNKIVIFGGDKGYDNKSKNTVEAKKAYAAEQWIEDYALKAKQIEEKRDAPQPEFISHGTNQQKWDNFFRDNNILNLIPKSESTLWNAEVLSLAQAKIDFNKYMSLFLITPEAAPGMYQAINSVWQSIRGNFTDPKLMEFRVMMKNRMKECRSRCWFISSKMRTSESLSSNTMTTTADYLEQTWDLAWDALMCSGAGLIFNRKKGYEIVLEATKSSSAARSISGNVRPTNNNALELWKERQKQLKALTQNTGGKDGQ